MKKIYRIKRLCFHAMEEPPYEDNPKVEFASWDQAWNYVLEMAESEADFFNNEADEGVSFGIPQDSEYNSKTLCRVEYYYTPEGDVTGNTEQVTHYWVYCEEV